MRKRAINQGGDPIAPDYGLAFNIQYRIGAEPRRVVDQAACDLVRTVPAVERSLRGRNSSLNNRGLDRSIETQVDRSDYIAKVVAHDERIAAFHTQLVEHRRFRKLELAAFFDRCFRALINQLSQFDILRVFGALYIDVAGDELFIEVTAESEIGRHRRMKIFRIIQSHIVAVKIDHEPSARSAGEQSPA